MVSSKTLKHATFGAAEDGLFQILPQFAPGIAGGEPADEALAGGSPEGEDDTSASPADVPENLTTRYFGEVRQFSLLTPAAERVAWARIEYYKARRQRALVTSPVALPTLRQYVQQAERGETPLAPPDSEEEATIGQNAAHVQHVRTALQTLTALHQDMTTLSAPEQGAALAPQACRSLRQQRLRLWQQWLQIWHALALSPALYEAIQCALEMAWRAQPHQAALRRAYAIWARAQQRLTAAQGDMLKANLRLVIHVAKRYQRRGVPLLDLIQEGNIGLMRAIEKFEPRREVRFVTYAHWWVRQAISRAVQEQNRTVRLPSHVAERQTKLRLAWEHFWNEQHRPPALQELSAVLGWSPQEIMYLQRVAQPIIRLQAPLHTDKAKDRTLVDLLEDSQLQPLDDYCAEAQLQHRLHACLDSLPTREAFILRLRYGLEADHAHSLQEIATILGLSRERVRQIERQALKRLAQSRCRQLLAELAEV